MPKKAKALTALEVSRLEKPGRHAVGTVSGLLLRISDSGAKYWMLRTKVGDKRRDFGIGAYPEVTLAKAIEEARALKESIRSGIDPVQQRKEQKAKLLAAQVKMITFDECASQAIRTKTLEFKNRKHAAQWSSTIETYVSPKIGRLPVNDIELSHILTVLEPIWTEKTETATRVRQRIEYILNWAKVRGYREGENPAAWVGNLDAILPKASKVANKKHFTALPPEKMGQFMMQLRSMSGTGAKALEFAILCAARSGEVRGATWDEIDLNKRLWTVPGSRMKAGKEHKVPLSGPAMALLRALPRHSETNLVFPSARDKQLSDNTLRKVCQRMGVDAVPHGFRSTFSDWCNDYTNYPRHISEMALAHTIKDKAEAAYNRSKLIAKRFHLMEDWGKFCGTILPEGKVLKFHEAGLTGAATPAKP